MSELVAWLDHHQISPTAVVMTIAILIAAAIVIPILGRLFQQWLRYLQKHLNWTDESTHVLVRIVSGALWVVTALLILGVWGASLGGLWTLLVSAITIIGVAFLATWAMISNFTASFFLTFWRPFRFGQTVEILPEKLKGRVVDRNLMFTVLHEENGTVLQVPNNIFFQKMFRVAGGPAPAMDRPREEGRQPSLAPK